MNKAVMLSIRPKWVEKIASGEKTIEVRKTRPKLTPPFRAYIYCSQGRDARRLRGSWGKVIGEFVCDKVDWITRVGFSGSPVPSRYSICNHNNMSVLPIDDLLHAARLTYPELADYLAGGEGYGWHISGLRIYDQPRELGEFWRDCLEYSELSTNCWSCENVCGDGDETDCNTDGRLYLHRPPQSWCYVEEG